MKKEVLFIAAGTRGAKQVGGQWQPYVPIAGRCCLLRVLEAAFAATTIDRIYLWGDSARLESVVAEVQDQAVHQGKKLIVVPEKHHLIESFLTAFLLYLHHVTQRAVEPWLLGAELEARHWELWHEFAQDPVLAELPINLLVSDVPLIQPEEIDCLVANKNLRADLVLGRTIRTAVEGVIARTPEPFCYDRAVKNYYNYYLGDDSYDLIVNNFVAGKPLKVPRWVWNLAGHLFNNRTIIEGGRFNLKKIKNNVVFVQSLFSKSHPGEGEVGGASMPVARKNYYQMLKAFSFLVRAYFIIVKNKYAPRKFRDLALLEERIRTLTHCTVNLQISDCPGPALDIDTEYEIEYMDRFFQQLRVKVAPRVYS
ncbi:MAG: hypothetical protein G8237_04430 [Magnetococcales bacterium]|nr:hypothetical protein [Magnetococcales bacterium]NGZ05581.1 hypothetical protein [Magnetococcales bacterium]